MSRWKAKHDKEHYYKLAKKQNYRSRASYKLKQLDKKYGLLKPDYNVVDLGAAPGGWSQVVAEVIGEEGTGQIISVDLEYIKPIDHEAYTGVKGDFTTEEIDELLAEFHRQDFTTFLVSNGMYWEKLGSLENEPTQLYVSLDAPNEKVYKELCNPQINDAWNNLNKTLELMNSFDSRTAIRITSVKGKNMINTDEYAKLINKANPKYVEVKAYMFVGSSRKRLSLDNMPSNQEVRDFAQEIADKTGRELTKESEVSRVVLLE